MAIKSHSLLNYIPAVDTSEGFAKLKTFLGVSDSSITLLDQLLNTNPAYITSHIIFTGDGHILTHNIDILSAKNLYKVITNGVAANGLLTADMAVITGSNGKLTTSSVTATELSYVSGARSNIQSQIDSINAVTTAGMTYKGTITKSAFNGLTTTTGGDTYKAVEKFTISSDKSESGVATIVNIGDTLVCIKPTPSSSVLWSVIPSGDEMNSITGSTTDSLNWVLQWTDDSTQPSFSPVRPEAYRIATIVLNGTKSDIYGKDTNTTYEFEALAKDGFKVYEIPTGQTKSSVTPTTVTINKVSSADTAGKLTNGLYPGEGLYVEGSSITNDHYDGSAIKSFGLLAATATTLGGIKIGYTTNAANRTYAVELDSNNKAFVTVPFLGVTASAESIPNNVYRYKIGEITIDNGTPVEFYGHDTTYTIMTSKPIGTDNRPAGGLISPTDKDKLDQLVANPTIDTWRSIKVDDTEILSTANSTNALNLVSLDYSVAVIADTTTPGKVGFALGIYNISTETYEYVE